MSDDIKKDSPESPDSHDRRKLIKGVTAGGIAAGVVAPDKWHRPVVDSVLLPAHAQTTTEEEEERSSRPSTRYYTGEVDFVFEDSRDDGLFDSLAAKIANNAIGTAHAHGSFAVVAGCVSLVGDAVDVAVSFDDDGVSRILSGSGELGEMIDLQTTPVGFIQSAKITLSLTEIEANVEVEEDTSEVDYDLVVDVADHEEDTTRNGTWELSEGPCSLSEPE